MNKKNDMKLCWNCDGSIGMQFETCPYCGVSLTAVPVTESKVNVTEVAERKEEGEGKKELFALLLLLPGIVLFLFGIALLFFSKEGVFTLQWSQNLAYFYFLGSIPLLYLGYKSLKS